MKIQLKTDEAIRFFISKVKIAYILGINSRAVRQWGEYVPGESAWRLYHLSKTHKYRKNGKLKVEIK